MPASGVAQALHLEQSYLIKTASEDVNDVAVVRRPFRQIVIELGLVLAFSRYLAGYFGSP
jgi:hypothetical protein